MQRESLNIVWSRGPDMPFSMNYYPNVAVLEHKVYVGGGGHYLSDQNMTREHTVMVYDIKERGGACCHGTSSIGFQWVS